MRVFVTGASGHIGSAVVPELISHGHQVVGLARSDDSAATLESWGAAVVRGTLADLEVLTAASSAADGVIHLAFRHDAMQTGDFMGAIETDLTALQTIAAALEGSGKPLVSTGGTLMLAFAGLDHPATEADVLPGGPRVDAENLVIGMADKGVRSSVVRLPPTVHSDLDLRGFVPSLIGLARTNGAAGYVGDGANVWPAGGTRDAARVYRLALEGAPAGSRLHAVGEQGVPFRAIAEAIGRHLGLPTVSVTPEDAFAHFTFLGGFVGADNPTSSATTRALLGWTPTEPGLLADLDAGFYFGA